MIMPIFRFLLIAACLGASCPTRAEEEVATAPPEAPTPAPSSNVTVNLINRLVQKGILSQPEALELIKQAEADAATAAQNAAAAEAPAPAADELRVTYIPEVVRNQMRDQIKQDLMAQAHVHIAAGDFAAWSKSWCERYEAGAKDEIPAD